MNTILKLIANPHNSAAKLYADQTDTKILSSSTCSFVEQTVTNLPERLNVLMLSGQIDQHENVILQKALLLLQMELSLLPEYQDSSNCVQP